MVPREHTVIYIHMHVRVYTYTQLVCVYTTSFEMSNDMVSSRYHMSVLLYIYTYMYVYIRINNMNVYINLVLKHQVTWCRHGTT